MSIYVFIRRNLICQLKPFKDNNKTMQTNSIDLYVKAHKILLYYELRQ